MTRSRAARFNHNNYRKSEIRLLFSFSLLIFFLKIIWLSNQPGQGMLGADGENYLDALNGLLKDGVFSKEGKLSYWPAGYPILMWPIARLNLGSFALLIGILQSLLFAISTFLFSSEIIRTSLRKFAWPCLFLLNLSPTLSLNSVVIGYEVSSAALLLFAITMYLRNIRKKKISVLSVENLCAAFALMLATFMQPRMFLIAIGILVPFAIFRYRGNVIAAFIAVSLLIVSLAPVALIFRNIEANGYASVSTNLGNTMNIGAGPSATGGYTNSAKGVPCNNIEGNASQQDTHKVACVLKWYFENPAKAMKLFVSKFFFHWSPWFGPLANGTMARNPWISFHPLASTVKSESGKTLIFGNTGKLVSWFWVLSNLALLGLGFFALRRGGGVSELLAWLFITPVVLNSLSSMATIGDHRFRIPTLTLSVLLQFFGACSLLSKKMFNKVKEERIKLEQI